MFTTFNVFESFSKLCGVRLRNGPLSFGLLSFILPPSYNTLPHRGLSTNPSCFLQSAFPVKCLTTRNRIGSTRLNTSNSNLLNTHRKTTD